MDHQHLSDLLDLRCTQCAKLLGKHSTESADLLIKCTRCGHINSLLNDGPQAMFLTDNAGVILYASKQIERLTGFTAEEVLGHTPAVWGKQMPPEFYKQLWDDILVQKKATSVVVTNRKKDGTLYEARVRISPILDTAGNVAHFLGIQSAV